VVATCQQTAERESPSKPYFRSGKAPTYEGDVSKKPQGSFARKCLFLRVRISDSRMGKKSACVAYLLWLIGGVVGLHHFYLGRDRHAFVWWATLGGVFGLGWLRDAVRIGEYVDDANGDLQYMEVLVVKMKNMKRPPFNSFR
jgi:TM2 domain-containing membrane protein YozV